MSQRTMWPLLSRIQVRCMVVTWVLHIWHVSKRQIKFTLTVDPPTLCQLSGVLRRAALGAQRFHQRWSTPGSEGSCDHHPLQTRCVNLGRFGSRLAKTKRDYSVDDRREQQRYSPSRTSSVTWHYYSRIHPRNKLAENVCPLAMCTDRNLPPGNELRNCAYVRWPNLSRLSPTMWWGHKADGEVMHHAGESFQGFIYWYSIFHERICRN